jgi:serine protease Do
MIKLNPTNSLVPLAASVACVFAAGLLVPGPPSQTAQAAAEATAPRAGIDIAELVRRYGPSVVAVHLLLEEIDIAPGGIAEQRQGNGSGFVVNEEGHIVTNFHVVAAALQEPGPEHGAIEILPGVRISVSFVATPDRQFPVRVLGANPDYDLALLEVVDREGVPEVLPLPLGDSDKVIAGEPAIAIGSPFGLHATVTSGIISAIERERPGLVGIDIPFIQTDAAINPGNSGGPLFNGRGEVIGINNAILASPLGPHAFIGVGFAVPINLLKDHMSELLAGGLSGVAAAIATIPNRPRLGLSGAYNVDDYPEALRAELGFPEQGLVVLEVSPGGPTDKAGVIGPTRAVIFAGHPFPAGGDVITEAAGQEVRRLIDLQRVVLEHEAGDVVTLKVWRDGEEREVEVRLEVVESDEGASP